MDNSETYIKMNDKAEEIQRLRGDGLWQNGDCYTCIVSGGRRFTAWWTDTEDEPPQMFHPVWLPRQDQLQVLSGLSWYLFDKTCVTWAATNPDYQRESKEIVGLRVVYKEKYNKVWNGEDWVKK